MRVLALRDEQFAIVLRALETFVTGEQKIADEQGLDVTADQEIAEEMLDAIEERRSPLDA
jgi:hypothetical protein